MSHSHPRKKLTAGRQESLPNHFWAPAFGFSGGNFPSSQVELGRSIWPKVSWRFGSFLSRSEYTTLQVLLVTLTLAWRRVSYMGEVTWLPSVWRIFFIKNTWQPNHQTMGKFLGVCSVCIPYTLPKFNMEPKNDGFQVRNLLFQGATFRWTMLNFGRVYTIYPWESRPLPRVGLMVSMPSPSHRFIGEITFFISILRCTPEN